MVRNWSGPMNPTSWPSFSSSWPVVDSVRTTPLICGCQASVMKRILTVLSLLPSCVSACALRSRSGGRPRFGFSFARDQPGDDFESAALMLDQRGAALDPVAVIAVGDAVDVAHDRVVNVTADH